MNTQIPEILNPLKHAGTSRFERLGDEMAFDFVQIEERHEADFIRHAQDLMKSVQYYDSFNQPNGDWSSFFSDTVDQSQPHKALFIAFVRLLEALNEHLNGLSKRHLDYYYKQVLEFTKREASPKHAHLFFKSANGLKSRLIERSEQFVAGEGNNKTTILFELVDQIVVNQAKVEKCFQLFRHSEDDGFRIFSKDTSGQIDNTEDGTGFKTFGEHQFEYIKDAQGNYNPEFLPADKQTMDNAKVGFGFASPLLRLPEGERTITAIFQLVNTGNVDFVKTDFEVLLTGEEGWHSPSSFNLLYDLFLQTLTLTIILKDTDEAVLDFDALIHDANFNTNYPVVQLQVLQEDEFAYAKLKAVQVKEIELSVNVTNFRSLIVQNDLAPLDASKPFKPFGPIPSVGNNFYIGHPEIFSHKLKATKIYLNWKDIPNANLSEHYEHYEANSNGVGTSYNSNTGQINNAVFKMNAAILQDKVWTEVTENQASEIQLFDSADAKATRMIEFSDLGTYRKVADVTMNAWNYAVHYGFIRFTLNTPDWDNFQAFGNRNHPREVLRNTQKIDKETVNTPYSPTIGELRLDYETEPVKISTHQEDAFFHVAPFGETIVNLVDRQPNLLPQFNNEGELFIGLSQVEVPQSVSLFINMIEGSADANQSQIDTGIQWHYLSNNEWKVMNRLRISKDTTFGLQNSGIIRFDFPIDFDDIHHIMPSNYFWIKASISSKSAGIEKIQSIHAQGAAITEINPEINNQVIEPGTIKKLENGGRGIGKIKQPYASFGGRSLENETDFYTRITERLRHKDRGVMIFDYERLVLDGFPDLYKVKCLNHTNYKTEMVAGHVMVAVIPNLINQGNTSPFQPKLSMKKRREIYDYLRNRISPFIYLRIENPIYEPIQLSFNVGFHEGYDEGFYGMKLHEQLQAFLSPWAFDSEDKASAELVFGGELHKSVVLKFIEDIEYVDFVNDFNMYHQYQDPRVREHFNKEITGFTRVDEFVHNSYDHKTGTGETTIKFAFQVDEADASNCLCEIKTRFLKGIEDLDDTALYEKFVKQMTAVLQNRIKKGEALTKSLVQLIAKGIYYVDKIISISFYKDLPNEYVLEDVDVAVAKTSRSIMVTSEQHRIGVYRAGDYKCEGNVMIGIGFMIVEADFIIPAVKQGNYEYEAR
ncbi:MAG: hypothetical protein ACI8ZM_001011 [Crocinitomix sp.]|jgi:hypothetical protein